MFKNFSLIFLIFGLNSCSLDYDGRSISRCESGRNELKTLDQNYISPVRRDIYKFVEKNRNYLKYDQSGLIKRYVLLNSKYMKLKVLNGLGYEQGFADGTVNNSIEDENFKSEISVKSNLKDNGVFFQSDNTIDISKNIKSDILKILNDQIYIVSGNYLKDNVMNSKVDFLMEKFYCNDDFDSIVVEDNVNNVHVIIELFSADVKKNELRFYVYYTKMTDTKYEVTFFD